MNKNHPVSHPGPAAIPGEIRRTHLVTGLDEAIRSCRLIVVHGPPGSGKTVSVAQWAREASQPITWVRADSWTLAGWETSNLPFLDPQEAKLVPAPEHVPVLVIDDLHLLPPAHAQQLASFALSKLPEPWTLIVLTRARTSHLIQQELNAKTQRIGAEQLWFSRDEVSTIAGLCRPPATSADVETVWSYSRGWPIAVRSLLPDKSFPSSQGGASGVNWSGGKDLLDDYVEHLVLAHLPNELAATILAATTCSVIDASQLSELLGTPVGSSSAAGYGAKLEECLDMGAFLTRTSVAPGADLYEWEGGFAAACQRILARRDPELYLQLHASAARVLAAARPAAAAQHAMQGANPGFAAELLQNRWIPMVLGGDGAQADALCAALPLPWAQSATILAIRAGCRETLQDRVNAGFLLERAARAAVRQSEDAHPRFRLARFCAELLHLDDHRELADRCDALTEILGGDDELDSTSRVGALFLLARMESYLRRDPNRSVDLLRAAESEAKLIGEELIASRARAILTFALAYRGDFSAAAALIAPQLERRPLREWYEAEGHAELLSQGFLDFWRGNRESSTAALLRATKLGGGGVPRMRPSPASISPSQRVHGRTGG